MDTKEKPEALRRNSRSPSGSFTDVPIHDVTHNRSVTSHGGGRREKEIARISALATAPGVTMASFAHLDEKKILRKMDLRLIPMLALLYLLSFLDRGNIGNAKIEGLTEDLGMSQAQYNWCLTVRNPHTETVWKVYADSSITIFRCSFSHMLVRFYTNCLWKIS